jgi:hypothetical protein
MVPAPADGNGQHLPVSAEGHPGTLARPANNSTGMSAFMINELPTLDITSSRETTHRFRPMSRRGSPS